MLFNKVQEPLLLDQLVKLERSVDVALSAGLSCLDERSADLPIYRSQLCLILSNSLYFLEVKTNGNSFYKIGITTRSISERIAPGAAGCDGALLGCYCQLAGIVGESGECGTVLQTPIQNV